MRRDLARAVNRLADQTTDRVRNLAPANTFVGTIADVVAGAASDGFARVTVTWYGEDLIVTGYLAAYTPVLGHRVLCQLLADGQLLILDRIVGYP